MENLSNKKAEDFLGDDDHNLMMNALQMLIVTYEGMNFSTVCFFQHKPAFNCKCTC